jgi:3-hydroxyacyl-[acyl-carrier-protein] dehydratase
LNLDPQILAVRPLADGAMTIRLDVPPQLPCFADHFAGAPMLPGVLQLGWAVRLAQQQFGIDTPLLQVSQLKFQHPIAPGSELSLQLRRGGARDVEFHYRTATRDCSSGRLSFADAQ